MRQSAGAGLPRFKAPAISQSDGQKRAAAPWHIGDNFAILLKVFLGELIDLCITFQRVHDAFLDKIMKGVGMGGSVEENVGSVYRGFLDHALNFALGVVLIVSWTYTSNLIASGAIAGVFGWYLVTRIEDYLFSVALATVIGFGVYAMSLL